MTNGIARDQLLSIVERILRLKEEVRGTNADIREVYAEAKSCGFDKTVLGKLVNYVEKRSDKPHEVAEADAMFDLYLATYDERPSRTHAHAREAEDRSGSVLTVASPPAGSGSDEIPASNSLSDERPEGQPMASLEPHEMDRHAVTAGETAPHSEPVSDSLPREPAGEGAAPRAPSPAISQHDLEIPDFLRRKSPSCFANAGGTA